MVADGITIFLVFNCALSTEKGAIMNIERFTKALSDILSEKYGVVVTIKAERREDGGKQEVLLAEVK